MTQYQAAIEVRAKAGLYDVENIVRREHAALVLADAVLSGASDLARVTAERDKLRAALEAVAKVTSKYGGQMSDLFGHDEEFNDAFDTVDAVLAETHKPQPEN